MAGGLANEANAPRPHFAGKLFVFGQAHASGWADIGEGAKLKLFIDDYLLISAKILPSILTY